MMGRRTLSLSLMISLSELALLFAFFTLQVSASQRQRARVRDAEQQKQIEELSTQVDSLTKRLKDSADRVRNLQRINDGQTTALDSLQESLGAVERELERIEREFAAVRAERDELRAALLRTEAKLADARGHLKRLQALIAEESSKRALAEADLSREQRRLADLEARSKVQHARWQALSERFQQEPQVAKAVLGLQGKMERVVIVCDCSGSMSYGGRWEQAREVVKTWTDHLDIGECALITFSGQVHTFTKDGKTFFPFRGEGGWASRRAFVEQLDTLTPNGGTNTLGALRAAFELEDVQTIILFTDGCPNDGQSNRFDARIAEQIYDLCRRHPLVTVNAVGLGNYFEPQLSSFLLRVAKESHGAFLGR